MARENETDILDLPAVTRDRLKVEPPVDQYRQYEIALDLLRKMGIATSGLMHQEGDDRRTGKRRKAHKYDILGPWTEAVNGAIRLYGVEKSDRPFGFSVVPFVPGTTNRTPGIVAEAAQDRFGSSTAKTTEKLLSTGNPFLDAAHVVEILYGFRKEPDANFALGQDSTTNFVRIALPQDRYEDMGLKIGGDHIVGLEFRTIVGKSREGVEEKSTFIHGTIAFLTLPTEQAAATALSL